MTLQRFRTDRPRASRSGRSGFLVGVSCHVPCCTRWDTPLTSLAASEHDLRSLQAHGIPLLARPHPPRPPCRVVLSALGFPTRLLLPDSSPHLAWFAATVCPVDLRRAIRPLLFFGGSVFFPSAVLSLLGCSFAMLFSAIYSYLAFGMSARDLLGRFLTLAFFSFFSIVHFFYRKVSHFKSPGFFAANSDNFREAKYNSLLFIRCFPLCPRFSFTRKTPSCVVIF